MTKLKGIPLPVAEDISLVAGTLLFLTTDKNKIWIEANDKRITEPRRLLIDRDNKKIGWIRKASKS